MNIFKQEPPVQQTQFTYAEPILEDPTYSAQQQQEITDKRRLVRGRLLKVGGTLLLLFGLLFTISSLSNREVDEPEVVGLPTAAPLPPRVFTPLQERIIGARERTEAIDIRSSELSLPQVDYGFELDEVKR